jgi:hypothetical protein
MLHHRQEDAVAFLQIGSPPRVGDQVDRLGGVAHENAFFGGPGVDELRHDVPGFFVFGSRRLGQLVHTAMNVGVDGAVVLIHRVDDLRRLLRARRAVQKDKGLPTVLLRLVQNREIPANLIGVERCCHL